jgi:hypothetical protein
MAYLYRHIRVDKNEVFYIGIGSDPSYDRANTVKGRNTYWKRIVNKTSFNVEIMIDFLSWEDACAKEKEFIKIYGRRDLGLGTLCNLTDGADGAKNLPNEIRQKIFDYTRKKVCQYDKNGKFIKLHNSLLEACNFIGVCENSVGNCARGRVKTSGGFVFRLYNGSTKDISLVGISFDGNRKSINQYTIQGKYINTYKSIRGAANVLQIDPSRIDQAIKHGYKLGAFIFKYNNGDTSDIDTSGMFVNKCLKKVDQFTTNGEFIETHNGLTIAQAKTGIKRSLISACCIGIQKTAGGFIWKHHNNQSYAIEKSA